MAEFVLKLAPGEQVNVKGCIVENCDRQNLLAVCTPGAEVFRASGAAPDQEQMTNLVLKLVAKERVWINGCLIENANADNRARWVVRTRAARVLREREMMPIPDRSTSARHELCYGVELLLTGQLPASEIGIPMLYEGILREFGSEYKADLEKNRWYQIFQKMKKDLGIQKRSD